MQLIGSGYNSIVKIQHGTNSGDVKNFIDALEICRVFLNPHRSSLSVSNEYFHLQLREKA